jgi:hypothetical protein
MGNEDALKTAFLETYQALKELVDSLSEESPEYLYAKNKLTQYSNFIGMGNGDNHLFDIAIDNRLTGGQFYFKYPEKPTSFIIVCAGCGKSIDTNKGFVMELATNRTLCKQCAGIKE